MLAERWWGYGVREEKVKVEHPNVVGDDGTIYLVRCPKCKTENYAPAVSSGVCAWCGFDASEKEVERQEK